MKSKKWLVTTDMGYFLFAGKWRRFSDKQKKMNPKVKKLYVLHTR